MIDYSVVIPAFGRPAELKESVASVVTQTIPAREILIVDDCSSVPISEALFGSEPTNLRIIRLPTNKGAGHARNVGMREAKGEYIALLDSDDKWDKHRLERATERINAPSSSDRVIFFDNLLVEGRRQFQAPSKITCPKSLLSAFARGDYFVQTSSFIFASKWRNELNFDARLRKHEDWDLLLRALQDGFELINLDSNLVYFRPGLLRPRASRDAQPASSRQFIERHRHVFSEEDLCRFSAENIAYHTKQGPPWSHLSMLKQVGLRELVAMAIYSFFARIRNATQRGEG